MTGNKMMGVLSSPQKRTVTFISERQKLVKH